MWERGRLAPEDVKTIAASGDRGQAGQSASACGLYLSKCGLSIHPSMSAPATTGRIFDGKVLKRILESRGSIPASLPLDRA